MEETIRTAKEIAAVVDDLIISVYNSIIAIDKVALNTAEYKQDFEEIARLKRRIEIANNNLSQLLENNVAIQKT